MKYSKYLLLIYLLMITLAGFSQDEYGLTNVTRGYLQTPNAASLGIFGQVPVSLFTGIPEITVPIYTLKEDNVDLNIALDYHLGTIKPNIYPSWVGLGWNLSAGGSIIRIPNGRRDEDDSNNICCYTSNYDKLSLSNWFISPKTTTCGLHEDLEPDEFTFNFGKYSGSFFLNHEGKWIVRSNSGGTLKITDVINSSISVNIPNRYIYNPEGPIVNYSHSYCRSYYEFTITTDDGVRYIFGGSPNSFEGNHNNLPNQTGILSVGNIDTWLLRKIVTTNNSEITFEYKRDADIMTYAKFNAKGGVYSQFNTCNNPPNSFLKYLFNITSIPESCEWGKFYQGGNIQNKFSTIQTPVYLSSITSDHYKIDFNSSESIQLENSIPLEDVNLYFVQRRLKLDGISIKNFEDTIVKNITFNYTQNNQERLKLLTMTESFKNNNNYSYTFQYNSKKLPEYKTQQIDYWGYYNGKDYVLNPDGLKNRSFVDINCLKAETLEEISYPTGGHVVFKYEPNEYSRFINRMAVQEIKDTVNTLTGGLRIQKIILLNNDRSTIKETNYIYKSGYATGGLKSSGILAGIPVYYDKFDFQPQNSNITYSYTEYNDYIPGPLSFTNGAHITYSEVTEKVSGNGFTVHTFTNFDTGLMYRDRDPINRWISLTQKNTPISSLGYIRGKALSDIIYSENGSKIKSIEYEYNTVSENDYVRCYPRKFFPITVVSVPALSYPYKIYTGTHNLIKKTTTEFDVVNPIIQTETYTYNSHNLLFEASVDRSDKRKQITKYVYPFDVKEGNDVTMMGKMIDKNILSEYVEKVDYIENGKILAVSKKKMKEFYPGIFKPEELSWLPAIEKTHKDLYPTRTEDVGLYMEYVAPPATNILKDTKGFSILKYPTKVNISMIMQQQKGYVNYNPRSLCFILTIKDKQGKVVYYREANDYEYGYDTDYSYEYNFTDEIELQPNDYIAELTHTSTLPDFKNLNVWYYGTCNVNLIEKTTSMSAQYSLLEPKMYFKFNNCGNIVESEAFGSNITTSYLWSYKNKYPVAEIKYATISDISGALSGITLDQLANSLTPDMDKVNALRQSPSLAKALITTYTYKPLVGMTSMTDPRGVTTYYDYDSFGRLKETYLIEGGIKKILQKYDYHYANQ